MRFDFCTKMVAVEEEHWSETRQLEMLVVLSLPIFHENGGRSSPSPANTRQQLVVLCCDIACLPSHPEAFFLPFPFPARARPSQQCDPHDGRGHGSSHGRNSVPAHQFLRRGARVAYRFQCPHRPEHAARATGDDACRSCLFWANQQMAYSGGLHAVCVWSE